MIEILLFANLVVLIYIAVIVKRFTAPKPKLKVSIDGTSVRNTILKDLNKHLD